MDIYFHGCLILCLFYITLCVVESKDLVGQFSKDQKLVGHFLKFENGYFIGYYNAVRFEMYGKFGQSK